MTFQPIAARKSSPITSDVFHAKAEELRRVSGEHGRVRFFGGFFWYFGSREAVAKIVDHFGAGHSVESNFSPSCGNWFVAIAAPEYFGVMDSPAKMGNFSSLV